MTTVNFVCHGNICRSPMAEYVFASLVKERGLSDVITVTSSAVSREEIGNDVYPPAKRELLAHGIPCPHRGARQITAREIAEADYLLCMDASNLRRLECISSQVQGKAQLLGEYGLGGKEIEDPWYTGNFARVFDEISLCCRALLDAIVAKQSAQGAEQGR